MVAKFMHLFFATAVFRNLTPSPLLVPLSSFSFRGPLQSKAKRAQSLNSKKPDESKGQCQIKGNQISVPVLLCCHFKRTAYAAVV